MTDRDLLPPMDETELRALLERSLADVRPPERLHDSALATGRRLRSRRRAGQVTVGLVAAAACIAVAVTTLGGSTGSADPGYAGDPTPSPTGVPTQSVEQGPQDDRPPGWWDMPSGRMTAVLRDVLPEGVTVTKAFRYLEGTTERTMASGSLHGVLEGPTGPGAFQVILYPPDAEQTVAEGSVPSLASRIRCRSYMTTCQPLLDGAGDVVGRVSTDEEGGTTYYDVMVLGPDGGGLYFFVGDSSGEKPGYEPPSAEVPPLTTEELVALAQDPAWTDYDSED